MNVVDDVLQRSLDLSCPEAARIVLLDPNPVEFDEDEGRPSHSRLPHLSVLRTSDENSSKPYQYFRDIRGFVIWLLQYRAYPPWKRLVILGSFCDQLHESVTAGRHSETLEAVEAYRDAVHRDLFDQALDTHRPQPAEQLETILELIVGRIGSDYTPPRFLACYQEFMQGIEWTAESSMDDIGRNYASAFSRYYTPFMSQHEHMLEHYLVSYVHRTLFPLGPQESNRELSVHHIANTIRDQCLLMLVHYAMIQTVLIGVAGFHETEFAAGHAIKVIQSSAKTFEHSLTFPARTLQTLAGKGVKTCASLAILARN
jgi:lysine-N-methylase